MSDHDIVDKVNRLHAGGVDFWSSKPQILPARSLARRLGVDHRWLIEEAEAGRLPGVRAGVSKDHHTYLFDPEKVIEVLLKRAQRVEG